MALYTFSPRSDYLSFPSQIAIEIDHPHLGTGEALGLNEILMERAGLKGLLPWARITTYFGENLAHRGS